MIQSAPKGPCLDIRVNVKVEEKERPYPFGVKVVTGISLVLVYYLYFLEITNISARV